MKIEEVAEATYCLETILPNANYTFSAYLIRETEGVLIEPGPATMIPSIQEGMKQLGMQSLYYIIPTHIHLDHGGGVGRLAELFPQARVMLHPRGARHIVDPSRLVEGTRKAYGDDFELTYGPILPVPDSQIMVPADGEVISINGRELQIFYAPGHALHQIAIYDRKTGGLFCGEALGQPLASDADTVLPSVSAQDFYLDLYLETIEKLEKLKPRLLFYSHNGGVREPADLISSLKESTLILDNAIFAGLKKSEATEAIERRIQESLSSQLGIRVDNMSMETTIIGYATYYRRKGLI